MKPINISKLIFPFSTAPKHRPSSSTVCRLFPLYLTLNLIVALGRLYEQLHVLNKPDVSYNTSTHFLQVQNIVTILTIAIIYLISALYSSHHPSVLKIIFFFAMGAICQANIPAIFARIFPILNETAMPDLGGFWLVASVIWVAFSVLIAVCINCEKDLFLCEIR